MCVHARARGYIMMLCRVDRWQCRVVCSSSIYLLRVEVEFGVCERLSREGTYGTVHTDRNMAGAGAARGELASSGTGLASSEVCVARGGWLTLGV